VPAYFFLKKLCKFTNCKETYDSVAPGFIIAASFIIWELPETPETGKDTLHRS
jgi:hypothetical protein